MRKYPLDVNVAKTCIDANLKMVERRDPGNFPRFPPQEWCAWTIPEIALRWSWCSSSQKSSALASAYKNVDPDQTAVWMGFIEFSFMKKSSLKCTWIYAADLRSKQHFQNKNIDWIRVKITKSLNFNFYVCISYFWFYPQFRIWRSSAEFWLGYGPFLTVFFM